MNLYDIDTSAITNMSHLFADNKRTDFSGIASNAENNDLTIFQISQLISTQKQDKLNMIMRWVAILSAIAAIFATVPVAQSLLNLKRH